MMWWEQAVRIFFVGFSGVFITLWILVFAIRILGKCITFFYE